jgi:hypothetical protein
LPVAGSRVTTSTVVVLTIAAPMTAALPVSVAATVACGAQP